LPFKNYGNGEVVMPGMEPKTVVQAGVFAAALAAFLLGTAVILGKQKND